MDITQLAQSHKKFQSVFYRLKHIPTGLYYQPSKGGANQKNNLSEKGKIYSSNNNIISYSSGFNTEIRLQVTSKKLLRKYLNFEMAGDPVYSKSNPTEIISWSMRSPSTDFEKEYI